MVNPPKQAGTAVESALIKYFRAHGLTADRKTLAGAYDQGDIWVAHGRAIVEVKTRKGGHSPANVESWLQELDRETVNASKHGAVPEVSLLVVKRVGTGLANPGNWHAYTRPGEVVWLFTGVSVADGDGWVQMPLWLAVDRLAEVLR